MNTSHINIEKLIAEAKISMASDPVFAINILMEIVRQNPSHLEAYYHLIKAFYLNGQIAKSKELYLGAINYFPEHQPFIELGYELEFRVKFETKASTFQENKQTAISNQVMKEIVHFEKFENIYELIDSQPRSLPYLNPQAKSAYNYFRQELRDGSPTYPLFINLANHFFAATETTPQIKNLGIYCLCKASENNPLDRKILTLLSQIFPHKAFLKRVSSFLNNYPDLKSTLDSFLDRWDKEPSLELFDEFVNQSKQWGEHPETDSIIIQWLAEIHGPEYQQIILDLVQKWESTPIAPEIKAIAGLAFYTRKNYTLAERLLNDALKVFKNCLWLNVLGDTYLAQGNTEACKKCWSHSLSLDPDQSHLYLKLDQIDDLKTPKVRLENYKICILLYSWNKADLLKSTLLSLSNTHIGNAQIIVLDNNSTDHMQSMLHQSAKLFTNNNFRVITLPTNIGAPAARNWLMAQPEAKDADYVAFLDDDIELFSEWLEVLITDLQKEESYGVAGFKINNPNLSHSLQYGGQIIGAVDNENLSLSRKHTGEPDYGQLNFWRPCLNVMGCCHVFKAKALYDVGEFDVRFSPSQIDDIDHDYKMALKGYIAHYNGHYSIIHKQMSGKATVMNRMARGNVEGNRIKLVHKHDTATMLKLKEKFDTQHHLFLRNSMERVQKKYSVPAPKLGLL